MVSLLVALAVGPAALAAVGWFVWAGFRNGDRPDDTPVLAGLRSSGQPGEERPVAIVAVRNPGRAPVLAAVAVRPGRLPGWLGGPVSIAVPRRTARRAYRQGFPTVAVVAGGQCAELAAPVPAVARCYLVTVLVGQAGGWLRVHRLRIEAAAANGGWGDNGTTDLLGLTGWARD